MGERDPTGGRIRERRLERGLRQAELAQAVGISPSYLNLIEYGRRRIGGKLLLDLARALDLDAGALAEGPEGGRVQALRALAREAEGAGLRPAPEAGRAQDLADRFPGWAALLLRQGDRVEALAQRVTELSGRLSHDRDLAEALHRVISAVTAIRSAAGILADSPDLDRDWRERFLGNIRDDSEGLAEASRALVRFLEAPERGGPPPLFSAAEEAERWLDAREHHLAGVEAGEGPPADLPEGAAGERLRAFVLRYAADAAALPLGAFEGLARAHDHDPAALARATGQPVARVLRRLAALPPAPGRPPLGLVLADAGGVVTHRKAVEGLDLPRSGACPFWPLFEALATPGRTLRLTAALPGEGAPRFLCHATAAPREEPLPGEAPVWEATMLVVPLGPGPAERAVGPGCRLCPREACPARREPSILR